jgi:SAM-dependent methyltransferase
MSNLFGDFFAYPVRQYRRSKEMRAFRMDLELLKKQKGSNNDFSFGKLFPILDEKNVPAGVMSGHYFHQDLLVARRVFNNHPDKHVDIGSRIDGFVAHVAAFREIEVFDIRTSDSKVKNIIFKQADLMQPQENLINYTDSISSLHAIEHFGLGRYGDPIDYYGYLKALDNIYRIVKPGGKFYFSVPIGPQRIEFNAHRVFNVSYLLDYFKNAYTIDHLSYVDDKGDLHENVSWDNASARSSFGCHEGCGIFELTKM